MPLPLSKIEQDALAAFVPNDVASYVAGGKFARVTFNNGKTIEYRGDLGWLIYREIRMFEQGLLAGVVMRVAQANELLERLGEVFRGSGKEDPRSAINGAARATGFLSRAGTEAIPEPDEVIGEDPA